MKAHRILIHSHDTYGLGHLRRSTLIAERLILQPWVEAVLITTGSPRAQSFDPVPGVETIKLPAALKAADGSYRPRTLGVGLADVVKLRSAIITAAMETFRPDICLVDHAPLGMEGELAAVFDAARRMKRRPKFVLGLRDVIDGRNAVRAEWDRIGAWRVLHDVYDRVVVYGDPTVRTTAQELDLETVLDVPVRHVGYLGRPGVPAPRSARPKLLVTAGGGGDGQVLLRAAAAAMGARAAALRARECAVDVVTGPFLSAGRRDELASRFDAAGCPVRFIDFELGLEERMAEAWGVIAMGGYNTVVELLRSGRPALLAPRTKPRKEQAIRAVRLARHAPFDVCLGSKRLEERIACFIDRILDGGNCTRSKVALDGLTGLVREVKATLGTDERVSRLLPGDRRAFTV